MRDIPYVPLLAALTVQTLATMAAYSLPAAAPAIAADVGVDGSTVGLFVSIVYGFGMISAMLGPGFIHRFGAIRVSQVVLLAALAMLAAAVLGRTAEMLALSGMLLGLGYGATAPASAHLLMRRTPRHVMNLVFSIRQIGVPLGGVLAGLIVPPLVLSFDWRTALMVQVVPILLMILLLQAVRSTYDSDRDPGRPLFQGGALAPLRLLRILPELRALTFAVFVFTGVQLCFVAFMAVHLTSQAGMDLIRAGQALAVYQVSGVVSRPIWGVLADRLVPARTLLGLLGLVMAGAALAAGELGPGWPFPAVVLVAAVAGATASGYTGIAYAEFARIGGAERAAETSGLGAAMMFLGVMLMPSAFSLALSAGAGYDTAYRAVAIAATIAGLLLLRPR